MTAAAYQHYKSSSEPWVRQIPAHWGEVRAKYLFGQRRERARPEDPQLAATQAYGVIPQDEFMELEGQKVVLALSGTSGFTRVHVDDFVISLRSFQGGIEHSAYSGCVTPAYTVLKPSEGLCVPYYRWLLKSAGFVSALNATTEGIREGKTVPYSSFGQIQLPVPPLEEQCRIAAFLDHETTRIDELVREQERLQALLEEKRNEVIGRAVREGLDGEETISVDDVFIRSAPKSWQISPLRRFLKHISPKPVGEAWRDYTLLSLTRQGIIERDIDSGVGKFPAEFNGYQRVLPGQVVFCLFDMDETPRTVGFSDKQGMITSAYSAFEPTEYGDGEFVSYYFQYVDSFKGLRPYYSGLRKTIRPSNFLGIRVAFPSLSEQKRIVRFLNAELEKLDGLAATVQNGIVLLLERRAALISAAVTGQLDLSDWQLPEPEAVAEVA